MAVLMCLTRFLARKGRRKLRLFNRKPVTVNAHGMPVGCKTMLVGDEFGSLSEIPKEHEMTFGFALTVVDRPHEFAGLTEHNRPNGRGEVKARNDPDRIQITEAIAKAGFKTYGFYIKKLEPPEGWLGSEAQEKMVGILNIALGTIFKDLNGNVYIVEDGHTALRGKFDTMIRSHSHDGYVVDGDTYFSKEGQFSDILQTHDYVAAALRGLAEIGDDRRTEILKMNVRRIGKDDSIKRRF